VKVHSTWPSSYDAAGNVLRCAETLTRSGMVNRVVVNEYDRLYRLAAESITPAGGVATEGLRWITFLTIILNKDSQISRIFSPCFCLRR